MKEKQEGIKVDVNKVIDNLTQQIAYLTKEMAILQAQNESLQTLNDKQAKAIKAYEDKEKLNAKK